jgi:hypothetical protein
MCLSRLDIYSKQKNRNSARALLRFGNKNRQRQGLFREINSATAVVKHDDQGNKKEQRHEDIQKTISLAARILNVFHFQC